MLQKGLQCSDYNIALIIKEIYLHIPQYNKYIYKLFSIFNYYCQSPKIIYITEDPINNKIDSSNKNKNEYIDNTLNI